MRIPTLIALVAGSVTVMCGHAHAGGCGCEPAAPSAASCPHVKVHVHYVPLKKKLHLCGPPAPIGPILNTEAFRRVPPPVERTRLRYEREVQQEIGELKEFKEKDCGGDLSKLMETFKETQSGAETGQVDALRKQIAAQEQKIASLTEVLGKVMDKLEELAADK